MFGAVQRTRVCKRRQLAPVVARQIACSPTCDGGLGIARERVTEDKEQELVRWTCCIVADI